MEKHSASIAQHRSSKQTLWSISGMREVPDSATKYPKYLNADSSVRRRNLQAMLAYSGNQSVNKEDQTK